MLRKSGRYITDEGFEELKRQNELFHKAILAYATLLAQRDGLELIEAHHIKKAARRIKTTYEESSVIKWVLTMSNLVLAGLALFQMSVIYSSPLLSLWLLPIYSIVWVMVITFIFREFL
jgi:hypothetical protein